MVSEAATDGAIENARCHWPLCISDNFPCAEHCVERNFARLAAVGNGRVTNCFLWGRKSDPGPLFYERPDGAIIANLDGYAIIPKEEYERLKADAARARAEKPA